MVVFLDWRLDCHSVICFFAEDPHDQVLKGNPEIDTQKFNVRNLLIDPASKALHGGRFVTHYQAFIGVSISPWCKI